MFSVIVLLATLEKVIDEHDCDEYIGNTILLLKQEMSIIFSQLWNDGLFAAIFIEPR